MLRIAVITSSYPRYEGDGSAPFIKSICEHLEKIGHDIEVIAPYDPIVNSETEGHKNVHWFRYIWPKQMNIIGHGRSLGNDVRIKPISYLLLPFFLIGAFLSLFRVTTKQKSDVIYAHWVIPNGLVAALVATLRSLPYVLSLHGSDVYITKTNPIYAAVAKWVFKRASAVTACSQDLKRSAISMGAPKDSLLLAWGADPSIFHPGHKTPKNRNIINAPEEDFIISGLGRFVHKKGFNNLLAAMPSVLEEIPNTHLVLGGDGILREELYEQAQNLNILDHVSFSGNILWDTVPSFLANTDIFVLPSVRDQYGNVDGLPTVLLEAMSSGTAVIATDIGGVNLVIENDKNGILVPSGNIQALSEAILNLLKNDDKRHNLGSSARASVLDQYNWNSVVFQISDLMEEIIKKKSPA